MGGVPAEGTLYTQKSLKLCLSVLLTGEEKKVLGIQKCSLMEIAFVGYRHTGRACDIWKTTSALKPTEIHVSFCNIASDHGTLF